MYKNILKECLTSDSDIWSLSRIATATALVLSSIGFIKILWTCELTEWYFIGYMGTWAGTYLTSKSIDRFKPNVPI